MDEGKDNEENDWDNEVELHMVDVCPLFIAPDSCYWDLVHYFQEGYFPEHWDSKQRRALRLKSASYQIIDGILFRKKYDGVLLRCLEQEDAKKVITELHDGPTGGHFPEIQKPIRFLELGITSPHCLNMLMLMSESVMFVKEVVEDKIK